MEHTSTHRRSVERMVMQHLRHCGIIGATAPQAREARKGPTLAVGIPGVTLGLDGELAVDGNRCNSERRTVSDLLSVGGEQGLYFADRAALATRHRDGYDPVLYHAFRSFLPPRQKNAERWVPAGTPEHNRAHGRDHLFADLIVYQPGTLPGGEPFRSTGHWNLPGQLEIFQTLVGRVLMLVGGRASNGRLFLYEQICEPGDTMAVPFDVWHVSYVLDGPAVVLNLTTDTGEQTAQKGEVIGHPGPEKYERAEPIAMTACRRGAHYDFVGSPAAQRVWGPPAGAPSIDWFRPWLAPGESLADLHLYASRVRLAELEQAARDAYWQCWPLEGGFQPRVKEARQNPIPPDGHT